MRVPRINAAVSKVHTLFNCCILRCDARTSHFKVTCCGNFSFRSRFNSYFTHIFLPLGALLCILSVLISLKRLIRLLSFAVTASSVVNLSRFLTPVDGFNLFLEKLTAVNTDLLQERNRYGSDRPLPAELVYMAFRQGLSPSCH